MQMILKNIYSTHIDEPLSTYIPDKVDNFTLLIKLLVGDSHNSDAADLFDMTICTPKWLLENGMDNFFPRGFLIVQKYNFENITNSINGLLSSIKADNWETLACEFNKFAIWEFDNYSELCPNHRRNEIQIKAFLRTALMTKSDEK